MQLRLIIEALLFFASARHGQKAQPINQCRSQRSAVFWRNPPSYGGNHELLNMQNKPNFQDAQMNVSNIITKIYQIFIPLAGYKNKPNSNPIKPNLRKAKMNINLTLTKDYRKKDDFAVRKNKPNFVNGPK